MGWRDLIKRSVNDSELQAHLIAAVLDVSRTTTGRLAETLSSGETAEEALVARFSQFSDCIVLSSQPQAPDSLFGFLLEVMAVVRGYLFHGLLVRGGVTVGDMYHDNEVAAGPALTEAYEIEQREAIYPRVVLSPKLWEYDKPGSPLKARRLGDDGQLSKFKLICTAPDGIDFLHYLHPLVPPLWNKHLAGSDMHLSPAKPIIMAGLSDSIRDPHLFEKFGWLASYYNATAEAVGSDDPIPLLWR